MLSVNELDVVLLKDGREAAILEICEEDGFLVEILNGDQFFINASDIVKITYDASKNLNL